MIKNNKTYYEADVHKLMIRFGIHSYFRGYWYVMDALLLIQEDPERLCAITKLLYPEIAKKNNTTVAAVERDIRLIATLAWKNNAALLKQLYGCNLSARPTNTQLLAVFYEYLVSKRINEV